MPFTVDYQDVSNTGLESSAGAAALAGLRANEARYFKNKYDHVSTVHVFTVHVFTVHVFTVEPADEAAAAVEWVRTILREERGIVIESEPNSSAVTGVSAASRARGSG